MCIRDSGRARRLGPALIDRSRRRNWARGGCRALKGDAMDEPLRLPRASAGRVDRRVDPRMRRWCDIIARLTAAGFAVTASLLVAGCVDGPPPFMVLNTDPVVPAAPPDPMTVPIEGDLHGEWDAWMGEIDRPIVENPIEGDLSGCCLLY